MFGILLWSDYLSRRSSSFNFSANPFICILYWVSLTMLKKPSIPLKEISPQEKLEKATTMTTIVKSVFFVAWGVSVIIC